MKLPLFTPNSTWVAPNLNDLPSWDGVKRIAVDIETHDPQLTTLGPGVRRDGYITGVSFAIEDGPSAYLPIAHQAGGNMDRIQVLNYLRDQAAVFKGDLVGANLQYDLDYLAQNGIKYQPRFFRDVQVAEPLLDELQFTYNLDAIAKRRGVPGKDETLLKQAADALGIDKKKQMWRLHAKFVGAYAEQDVRLPLQLLRIQEREIEKQDLWDVYNMESKLLPVLLKMRRRGVRLDFDEMDRIEAWAIIQQDEALAELKRLTGIGLVRSDITKSRLFLPMIEQMGVKIPWTDPSKNFPEGQPSLKGDWLDTLAGPIGGLINRARAFNKLNGTFVNSRREHAINGRVHPTFTQLRSEKPGSNEDGGARYGRCASRDPNLQQEPSRHPEIGPRWRRVYLPDDGGEWLCEDYSQQEPRWAVHFAEAMKQKGAKDAGDRYRNDPNTDSHDMMATIINPDWPSILEKVIQKRERSNAKNIFLGLCYGEGEAKLCRDLGLPTKMEYRKWANKEVEVAGPEGRKILDNFTSRVPWLLGTTKKASSFVRRHGYIRTVGRRKCRFPKKINGRGYDWTYKAFNRLIQGSSGDQMKTAMVLADAEGFKLQLQVHDELDLTIGNRQEAKDLAEIMVNAVPCSVPHRVDIEIGPNWADLKEMK